MLYLYIILAIISIYILFCAYIKIKFRLWAILPVFHIYDFMYWIFPPGVINKELPEMNNYINLLDIKTENINKLNDTTITRVCNFINSYYLRERNAEYNPQKENIIEYLKNSNHASYISIYREPKLLFAKGEVDKVVVVYNKFKNAAVQEVMSEQFLPIIPTENDAAAGAGDYIFEPSKEEIVTEMIPKSLKVQLFKAFLDSHASEHGARMTAMHKATDNASELKRTLTLDYNKARQAAITNEILEIVGGAEALKNG